MQGSIVMCQRRAKTLATEEPDALIAHVRVGGGAGWVTTGSTRKATATSVRSCLALGFRQQVSASVRLRLWVVCCRMKVGLKQVGGDMFFGGGSQLER